MLETKQTTFPLLQGVFPFSDLDQRTLAQIAPLIERCNYAAGVTLYEPTQDANYFYFILSGQVEIFLPEKKDIKLLAVLNPFDHFGEDALADFCIRHTQAVSKTRVLLLRISRSNLHKLQEISPMLRRVFKMFLRSYQILCKLQLPWRQAQETVYLLSRRHVFFLWIRIIPILVLTLALFYGLLYLGFTVHHGSALWIIFAFLILGFGVVIGSWAAMEWSNDYYILTRDRVIMQKKVVGVFDGRQETPMSAILSTGMDSTFFGRVFGFGAVTARAYTGDMRLNKLPDPDLVYALLEHRRRSLLHEQRRQEQEGMQSILQERLKSPEVRNTRPLPRHEPPMAVSYYTDSISDLLARFFGLRSEKDGAVIYRTHWWILMGKTILPVIFIILVAGIVIARLSGAFAAISETLVYSFAIMAVFFGGLWWLYEYADWHNDVYIITEDQLVDINRRPLGSEEKRSAPVKNIQTVEYKRNGIISLMLNFGTVQIQIGNEELTFDNVYNPSAVQMEIFNHLHEVNEHTRKLEQKRMADWITTYDGIRHTDSEGGETGLKNG